VADFCAAQWPDFTPPLTRWCLILQFNGALTNLLHLWQESAALIIALYQSRFFSDGDPLFSYPSDSILLHHGTL